MEEKSNVNLSFGSILQLIFITLKLTGYINWSWWWVLSPTWISLGLFFIILLIAFIIGTIIMEK